MLKKSLLLWGTILIGQFSFSQVIETTEPKTTADTSAIWTEVEVEPEFNGGYDALTTYLINDMNLISKEKNKKSNSNDDELEGGRVIVRFVIETDGNISNVVLEKRLPRCEPCNQEAIRVVKNMPKWEPGSKNGKAVRTYVRLPLIFEID